MKMNNKYTIRASKSHSKLKPELSHRERESAEDSEGFPSLSPESSTVQSLVAVGQEGQGKPSLEPSTTTLSQDERIPSIDIVNEFEILFYICENIVKKPITQRLKTLSQMKRIFASEVLGRVFFYLVEKKAFSAWDIQVHLNIPEATAYKHIKTLRSMGILTKALKAKQRFKTVSRKHGSIKRSGPYPTIWQSQKAEAEDIIEALNRHYRSLSPKYRVAEKLAQIILTDIIEKDKQPEIKYHEITQHIKDKKLHRELTDIADLTAQYLHEQGVKVWR